MDKTRQSIISPAGKASSPVPRNALPQAAQLHQTLGNQAMQRGLQPGPAWSAALLRLQPVLGNQGVIRRLQSKLTVNTPGDQFEQQADRMADAVMRAPSGVQRKCACGGTCANCQESLQMKIASPTEQTGMPAPPVVDEVLESPGQPLDAANRAFMESRFGHDFSDVRVHTDVRATDSARAVSALAYTVGPHVVFGSGQYTPDSFSGRNLIAHELTHVLQQRTNQQVNRGEIQRRCGPDEIRPSSSGCQMVNMSAVGQLTGVRFLFNVNCDDFAPGEQARLEALIDPTKLTPGTTIQIRGLASSDGDAGFNNSLSCSRADAAVAVIQAKGAGANIKAVVATGGVPGTSHDPQFRAVEVTVTAGQGPARDPVFSIVGKPKVTAVVEPSDASVINTLQVHQAMGDFDMDATVSAQAAQASDFNDWEAGPVQTVVSPIHQRCFRFPAGVVPPPTHQHPNEAFVANLQNLPGLLVPDRDDSDPIFVSNGFRTDLQSLHQGNTSFSFHVKTHDTPALGGLNGLFNITNDPLDSQSLVFREHKFLFALTDVIARQKSSGRVIPLYRANWFTFWDIAYDPSAGTGIPPVEHVLVRKFEPISDHVFSNSDVPPLVGGKAIRNFKLGGSFQPACPSF